jgi:hypothetical protein
MEMAENVFSFFSEKRFSIYPDYIIHNSDCQQKKRKNA